MEKEKLMKKLNRLFKSIESKQRAGNFNNETMLKKCDDLIAQLKNMMD